MAQKATYFSSYLAYSIVLRSTKTVVVDGTVVKKPGIHVQFRNGKYTTDDPEIIKMLDGLLNGDSAVKFRRMFRKLPGEKAYKEAKELQEAVHQTKEVFMEKKATKDAVENISDFDAFLATQTKGKRPDDVKGMRNV